jgi:hypothetical protein
VTNEELDEMIRILGMISEVLGDLTREPTAIVPSGVWRRLHDAVAEFGDLGTPSQDRNSGPPLLRVRAWLEHLKLATAPTYQPAADDQLIRMIQGLDEHGFTGAQLRFKTAVIDTAYANYVSLGRVKETPKNDAGWIRRTGRRIRKVLEPAATFVDSLSNVPGLGFLGLVSEAISGTTHSINLAEVD